MKIVRGNFVFLELFDYEFLLNNLHNLPDEVKNEIFCGRDTIIIDEIIDEREFICIEGENLIKFLNNLDYIIDYDKMRKLSFNSICNFYNNLYIELDEIRNDINSGKKITSFEKADEYINKLDQLEYKVKSVLHYFNFLEGKDELTLPNGIEYPKEYLKVKFDYRK